MVSTIGNFALVGNTNCGKTALFNLLTGSRQKVANYAGVTVERKQGLVKLPGGAQVSVLDLPGAYSLNAMSADEAVTRDVITGQRAGEAIPDGLVCVVDASNLQLNLRLVLEVKQLGLPMVLALNMSDAAQRAGLQIDTQRLSDLLQMPVVPTVGIRAGGADDLMAYLAQWASDLPRRAPSQSGAANSPKTWQTPSIDQVLATQMEVRRILQLAVVNSKSTEQMLKTDDAIDRVVLHPLWGMLILAATLFLMFQAVFSWATWPMDVIKDGVEFLADQLREHMALGMLQSLLADGVLAGAGGVLVFLPQILILFFFILILEDSGYLPRAAFLLDRVMGSVGLSGRSFIPLLSSFACAIPGIMATRTITHWRDRLVTIMVAPLMTCSARLPVYALLIAAFVPARTVAGVFNLQGLVMFGLYLGGIVSAMAVAYVFKLWRGKAQPTPLLMELPAYRWPSPRNLFRGLYERAQIFVTRVGSIILALMVVLWFLSTFPGPPAGWEPSMGPAIQYSLAGRLGRGLEVVFAPIGFNWQIAIALVPGLAAREVAVGALGTVYALSATGEGVAGELVPLIAQSWSLATALSLLVWYVFAPQCISTLATVKRETNSWRYVAGMAAYLFVLAYGACWLTYHLTLWATGG
jgi:ferrous iron transport protein B